jgi:predicted DNA-binding protein (UPF0251 family)
MAGAFACLTMTTDVQNFTWNQKRLDAVRLVAEDALKDEVIAQQLGISRMQLHNWKRNPAFQVAVSEYIEAVRAAIRAEGIASKQNRIDAYNRRWNLMHAVIEARAEANRRRERTLERESGEVDEDDITFDSYAAAGVETGLMVHTVTYLKDGRREEWAVDTALLSEMRATEKQAAQELEQWTDGKIDGHSGGAISAVTIQIAAIDYRAAISALAPAEAEDGSMGDSAASR